MEQLIYVSTAARSVAGGEVFDIIQKSSMRNAQRGITGFLVFTNGQFFQYVEGEAAALDTLLGDLAKDPRHHSIRVIHRAPCAARTFPDWRMKRLAGSAPGSGPHVLLDQLAQLRVPQQVLAEVERCLEPRAA